MTKSSLTLILLLIVIQFAFCQKTEQLISNRTFATKSYVRINYENDLFTGRDQDYTQGFSFTIVAPLFKENLLNSILLSSKNEATQYGISLTHLAYTPERFEVSEIQFDVRPFAAVLSLSSFNTYINKARKSSLFSGLQLGIIGPGALGKEIQIGIHKITGDNIPQGWRNQIKNDIIINYELGYEKELFRINNLLNLKAFTNAKLGTLFTNGTVGLTTIFGLIENDSAVKKSGIKFYGYAQTMANIVGYDATLQGGLFTNNNIYTINSKEIERLTGQVNFGIIVKTNTLFVEYSLSLLTREFATGTAASWGGIKLGHTF